ncbi:hypothetical protein BpHYR1_007515, partial [Brachionus plicatilis]
NNFFTCTELKLLQIKSLIILYVNGVTTFKLANKIALEFYSKNKYCQKKNCDPTPLKDRKKNKTNSLINKMIDILAKNGKKMSAVYPPTPTFLYRF